MAGEFVIPEVILEKEEEEYIKVVAEPLQPGFGTTLGNSLRRILLSSLPGAAITWVRIEGIEHEFSSIDYMKEDIVEFLLNLKEVRLKAFADRPSNISLNVTGSEIITAGMIEVSADYEIMNPDLYLATLTDTKASLNVDMYVQNGIGFVPSAENKKSDTIGIIPVDSVYSPIRRVNFNVTNTRVGQDTNFDKLEMDVWTDGTIEGKRALSISAEILRDQLFNFYEFGKVEVAEVQEEEVQPFEGHDTPIEHLGLSVRAYNCLKRSGLITVGIVLERPEEELMSLRNFGLKSYVELKNKLVAHGFPAPRSQKTILLEEKRSEEQDTEIANSEINRDDIGSLGQALMDALVDEDGS
ncbi:MAG: DNA-directed RNA polymerase subunit alpha [Dehalococcoidia bacterium]|nr:DNA-directed RNA polymerase subunit alpha [Dehalococcoidia bacterium]